MESYLKLLNTPSNGLSFEFVSLVILTSTVFSLITLRNKKSQANIQQPPLLTFATHAIRAFLGIPKTPIYEVFRKMGSLLSVPYYSSPMIVVSNDYEAIKQMLNSTEEWLDRPKNPLLTVRGNGVQDRGILMSSGNIWKATRRYTVKTLAQLGLGKRSNLEYTANEELKGLLEDTGKMILKTNNNVPVRGLFSLAAINVIWRIAGGNRFSMDDPEFIEIVEGTHHLSEISIYQMILADFFGRNIVSSMPGLFKLRKAFQSQDIIKRNFTNVLQKRQDALTWDENDLNKEENFTDHFLRQMNSNNNNNDKLDQIFNINNLIVTLFDLFEAGVDTTSSTLEFAAMFLSPRPDVQEKIRNEITTVIGDKEPSFYSDRINMPYTQAVISEVHRMATIVPFTFRSAVRDSYIKDTLIKQGTGALINLYSIHYDETFWVDPYNFRPERFLTSEGQLDNTKLRRLLNFGAGKRVCIGESVANSSVFTFLVGILQKYELQKADPNEVFGMEINSAFTNRAKPFHVRFVPL